MFRFKSGVDVNYDRQGLIYFTSRLYNEMTERERGRIRELCRRAAGEYWEALLEFVTSDAGATAICMRHALSRSTLERAVRRYYELFPRRL